mgnify:FL=1
MTCMITEESSQDNMVLAGGNIVLSPKVARILREQLDGEAGQ